MTRGLSCSSGRLHPDGASGAFLPETERAQAAATLQRRTAGSAEQVEYRLRRKDGTECWALMATAPWSMRAATISVPWPWVSDITERTHADAALRLQSELIEQAHEAIFAWDRTDGISFWNRGAAELYRYSPEEALGRRGHDLLGTPLSRWPPSWPRSSGTVAGRES